MATTIEEILAKVERETPRWGDEKFNEGVSATIAAVRKGLSELPAPEPEAKRRKAEQQAPQAP